MRHYAGVIDEKNAEVRVDCGFIALDSAAETALKPGLHKLGRLGEVMPIDLNTMDVIGTKVISIGITRGIQAGEVAAFSYEHKDEADLSRYTDLLIIGDEPGGAFAHHGDSGKIVVTRDGLRPLGLLWGGWEERLRKGHDQEIWAYATDMTKVLDYLEVSILYE